MQVVEISAKTIQDATNAAAEKLGVGPDAINVTVLEETKGLFGKTTVRVRAELKEAPVATPVAAPAAPSAAKEKPARKSAKAEPKIVEAPVEEAAAPVFETPVAPVAEKAPPRKLGKKLKTVEAPEAPATAAPVAAAPAPTEARPARGGKPKVEAEPAPLEDGGEEDAPSAVVATEADGEALIVLVRDMLAASGLNVDVKVTGVQNRYVNIQLDGKDAAFLVGKHGEVLNALQYLVNIVSGRKLQNGVRATIDANDYRRRREDALTNLANKIADQVVARGEEAVLDALPAFERRVVHKALSTRTGVTTYSEGEEPNRRVVIAPGE